ncbi:sperm-associated antigen 8 [Bombina bombina]|uniref:sperm-associated antigen 8 n=1 Tax=Bombina bombina TaxID=8345 RepID=UPI00235AC540|nr:sperm-associated antigen 8 [Bombina bombina]
MFIRNAHHLVPLVSHAFLNFSFCCRGGGDSYHGNTNTHRRTCSHSMAGTQTAQAEQSRRSQSPCLLHNWVEERAAASLDNDLRVTNTCVEGKTHKYGHRGILSTELLAQMAENTTHKDSYGAPSKDSERLTGKREEMLHRFLYQKFSTELLEERGSQPNKLNLTESTTHRDYSVEGFIPRIPQPSKSHDYRTEPAVTFWTENIHKMTGISDIQTADTQFKKTSAFSTPISQYLDQPLPHSLERCPI